MIGGANAAAVASPFDASSPGARAIADLFTQTLVVCGVIFVIVTGLIAYAGYRFRDRGPKDDTKPAQTEGHTRLEIGWTLIPFFIVVGLLVLTMRAMSVSDPPPDREPDIVVIGHQWWWEARYKDGPITANEIHIPTGKQLVVAIESADVVHDFWVPELGRKIDATPGRRSTIWLGADKAGKYLGACAEYCGAEHAWMRILVVAHSPEEYAAWESHEKQPAQAPRDEPSARGEKLFRAKTCVRCHDIAGRADGARVAPDLTHIAERETLGAGVTPNTADTMARWLKQPESFKPASHMPNLGLDDGEVADLTAYFETLK